MANPVRRRGWIPAIWLRAIAVLALAIMMTLATAQAQTFTVLHAFEGGTKGDGSEPGFTPLTQDAAGNFYGTTRSGGDSWGCDKSGCGTVFELRGTKETVLHKLSYPQEATGVTLGENGNLYGIASFGGAHNYGAVFQRIAGKWSTLYSFKPPPDVSGAGSLVRDSAGNLYGIGVGGKYTNGTYQGAIFKVDPGGKETMVYRFKGPPNDGTVAGGSLLLLMDAAGNFYGTTSSGGSGTACGPAGCGTIFKVDPTGKETVLYNFAGPPQRRSLSLLGVNPGRGWQLLRHYLRGWF